MNDVTARQQEQWRELLEQPLDFVRAEHLAACFPEALSVEQLGAFRDAPRFQKRSLRLLMSHFDLQPLAAASDPDVLDLPVLLLAPDTFKRLPRLCGAIWHGATLSREIRSDVVSQLRQLLGNDVFSLALANRPLAGAADLLRQPAELLQAIDRDGAACVSAWLQALSPALRGWLRLRFDDPTVQDGQDGNGPLDVKIIRRAAATLAEPVEELA
ncbi:type III secretion protein [Pseudomonas syringae]|uniref:Type III secretion protein n=1 Tax=Pseudomonas syringae TaxID=317 RepID=A0A1C7Z084_PSESX|nr:type III secretion protein [Pseudomonas syringae]OCR23193.1 type III secretion protein [Pseudomonas syringae]